MSWYYSRLHEKILLRTLFTSRIKHTIIIERESIFSLFKKKKRQFSMKKLICHTISHENLNVE